MAQDRSKKIQHFLSDGRRKNDPMGDRGGRGGKGEPRGKKGKAMLKERHSGRVGRIDCAE